MSSPDDRSRIFRVAEGGGEPPAAAGAGQETAAEQEIDLQALASKVYDLLKQELRLERERLGRNMSR
jgi:hypothetical protein